MGLLGNILSVAVKTVSLPLDVVEDTANILSGDTPKAVENKGKSILKDLL